MKYRVHVTAAAEDQIEAAAAWWAEQRSLEQALRWMSKIREHIMSLARNPERCPLAVESSRFPFELRELLFGTSGHPTHRILFRITGSAVEVLSLRHASQDQVEPDDC